ncbi:DUF3097 domain-containing protein [Isoptericola croceus]|uniref:DUF3097 domain-containing protein n=1 Tax=Isoptericola croceus TaxID=3031406 RepID=UPI0023F87BB7|nr:DUF3097 domain-containing protein [Isoptericola croceus]
MHDRYGSDVLASTSSRAPGTPDGSAHHRRRPTSRPQPAEPGLVVEEVQTGWVGAVVHVEKSGGMHLVVLEDRRGRTRSFPLGPGFWVDGQPVELTAPVTSRAPARPTRTASGSVAVHGTRARVARGSRIWVEGKHDAELVEKVWGDDLRVEGVVVEMLDGVDNLADALAEFVPSAERRVGVLVDHLVPGSKEQRITTQALRTVTAGTVLVLGHPYVDVWQAVRPARVGLERWPTIDRGTEWKIGILQELGWPASGPADVGRAWQRILASVRDFRDLDPALLGRVEELIDFVTA